MAELSFFFALPILGKSPDLSASNVAACLAAAVILESILLITTTSWLEKFSRKKIIAISLILRIGAFLAIYIALSLTAWVVFFILTTISKSISKPFLREILVETMPNNELKKALYTFSLFQNAAVFLAPILAVIALSSNTVNLSIILLIIICIIMTIITPAIIYDYPSKKNLATSLPAEGAINALRGIWKNKNILLILLSSFACYLIMGLFITATTLLDKINPEMGEYSGLFFSVVGISICICQSILVKLSAANKQSSYTVIYISGIISASFLLGSVYIAIIALIAYSIYESMIIPEMYFKANHITSDISTTVIFSYIIIAANLGQAFGSWLTGFLINNFLQHFAILLAIAIAFCVWVSVFSVKIIKYEI